MNMGSGTGGQGISLPLFSLVERREASSLNHSQGKTSGSVRRYRIIDFTLSNCINSGIRKIAVLTQYKSLSIEQAPCAWLGTSAQSGA